MSPRTPLAAGTITPEDIACLRAGLWSLASEPAWNLAMRTLDRIEGKAVESMTPRMAEQFMATIMAPVALKAAEGINARLRERVRQLESFLRERAS